MAALLAAAVLYGQGRVIGTVTAIDPVKRTLSLQSDQGQLYAVLIVEDAKLSRVAPGQTDLSKAESIDIGALSTGDRVLARGQQNDTEKTLLASQVVVISKQALQSRDAARQQEWRINSVAGIVKTLAPLTIQSRGNTIWTVDTAEVKAVHRYADDSSRFQNARVSSLDELAAGDQIKILGPKDPTASTIKANEIVFGRFVTIGGEIKSLNVEAQSITLYDLSTKKNVTISISPEVRMTRLSGFPGVGSPGIGPRRMAPNGPPAAGSRGPAFGSQGGAAGRPGGPMGGPGGPDPSMLLERLPPAKFTDLQVGDAVVVTVGKPGTPSPVALSLVAGLDFLLRAPSQQATQMIANWNMDGGLQ